MPKDELVGAGEIAEMFGVSRQRIDQLARSDGFPEAVAVLRTGRIWRLADVKRWARKKGRLS